jgi:hypothetical protein
VALIGAIALATGFGTLVTLEAIKAVLKRTV